LNPGVVRGMRTAPATGREDPVYDVAMVALGAAFFVLTLLYTLACERL
jgi:hypothetical protein